MHLIWDCNRSWKGQGKIFPDWGQLVWTCNLSFSGRNTISPDSVHLVWAYNISFRVKVSFPRTGYMYSVLVIFSLKGKLPLPRLDTFILAFNLSFNGQSTISPDWWLQCLVCMAFTLFHPPPVCKLLRKMCRFNLLLSVLFGFGSNG